MWVKKPYNAQCQTCGRVMASDLLVMARCRCQPERLGQHLTDETRVPECPACFLFFTRTELELIMEAGL